MSRADDSNLTVSEKFIVSTWNLVSEAFRKLVSVSCTTMEHARDNQWLRSLSADL